MRKSVTGAGVHFVWHPRTPHANDAQVTVGFSTTYTSVLTQVRVLWLMIGEHSRSLLV